MVDHQEDSPIATLPIPHVTTTRIPNVDKIPYEDPRKFKFDRNTSGIFERRAEYEDVPRSSPTLSAIEAFLRETRESNESGAPFTKTKLEAAVVEHLYATGYLRIAPRTIQESIATNKTKKAKKDFAKVAQNMGFVPLPENYGEPGLHGILDDEGRHVVVTTAQQIKYPKVYLFGEDGCIISCERSWTTEERAKNCLNDGTGIVLGRRTYWIPGSNKYRTCFFGHFYNDEGFCPGSRISRGAHFQ